MAVICLALRLAASTVAAAPPETSPAYEATVRRYAGGDREAAVAEILTWPEERLRRDVRSASSLAATAAACSSGDCVAARLWSRFPVRAALMLHTDASLELRRRGESPRMQESAAAELARLATADRDLANTAADWYAAMALSAQSDVRWSEALDWAQRGLKAFPASPELLLVVASVEEVLAAQDDPAPAADVFDAGSGRLRASVAGGRERRTHLEQARAAARAAVVSAPERDDARVRLGRIAWRLGDLAEARASLEAVVTRTTGGAQAYLAQLFLGRVCEDEGRPEEAARSYETAATLAKRTQTAPLALSLARFKTGDVAAARKEIEAAIRPAGYGRPTDPFWSYGWGASDQAAARLEDLRRRSSS